MPNPCKNSGNCSQYEEEAFTCDCAEGFLGTNCEKIGIYVASKWYIWGMYMEYIIYIYINITFCSMWQVYGTSVWNI